MAGRGATSGPAHRTEGKGAASSDGAARRAAKEGANRAPESALKGAAARRATTGAASYPRKGAKKGGGVAPKKGEGRVR